MSDRTAFTIAALIGLAIIADIYFGNSAALYFLVRKLADFVEYLSFWR